MIASETSKAISENHTGVFNHVPGVSIEQKELELTMRLQATEWLYSNRYAWGEVYLNQLINALVEIAISENWTPPAEDWNWPPTEINDTDEFLLWLDPILQSAERFHHGNRELADLIGSLGNWLGWRVSSVGTLDAS